MAFPTGGYNNSTAAIADGCLHYWPMNESSGTTVTDTIAGGQGQVDGTITSDISDASIVTGKFGSGRDLTGPGLSPHAVLTLSRNAGTNATSYSEWSLSFWFYVTDLNNGAYYPRLIGFRENSGSSYTLPYIMLDSNGAINLGLPFVSPVSANGVVTAGNIYHCAITKDSSNNVYLYINDSFVITTTETSGLGIEPYSRDQFIACGAASDLDQGVFHGWVDEVSLWNRDLTSSEVSGIYNSGAGTAIINTSPGYSESVSSSLTATLLASHMIDWNSVISPTINLTDIISSRADTILNEAFNIISTTDPSILTSIIESLSTSGTLISSGNLNIATLDNASIFATAYVAYNALISEVSNISTTLQDIVDAFFLISESLQSSDIPSTQLNAFNILSIFISLIGIANEITPIVENITTSLSSVNFLDVMNLLQEGIELSEENLDFVKFLVIIEDNGNLDDSLSSLSEIHESLSDSMIFMLQFQLDSINYSGWVMNPENYAVTNYTNHPFNSSAIFNNNTIFAGATGLYQLGGVLDDTSYITARLKTAATSFGTSNIKQVPEALLGVNNSGKVILIASVDGKYSATYELSPATEGLSTQQIKLGKGLKGRYWQFELITQDNTTFDLDSFELLPITFGRKI